MFDDKSAAAVEQRYTSPPPGEGFVLDLYGDELTDLHERKNCLRIILHQFTKYMTKI